MYPPSLTPPYPSSPSVANYSICSYWLFNAILITLANIFCTVHVEPDGEAAVQKALAVMSFCGTVDPQARRYHIILESFHSVLTEEAAKKTKEQGARGVHEDRNVFDVLFGVEDARAAAGSAIGEDALYIWGSEVRRGKEQIPSMQARTGWIRYTLQGHIRGSLGGRVTCWVSKTR